MKFWEATKALEEGKKVRRSYWEEDSYIYIDSDNNLRDNYGGLPNLYYIPDDDDDWEIYEDKKEVTDDKFKQLYNLVVNEQVYLNRQYEDFIKENKLEDHLTSFYMQLLEMHKYYNFEINNPLNNNIKVFIATRADKVNWDECREQTILAYSEKEALEIANKEYGEWKVQEITDLVSQTLTKSFVWG